MYSVPTARRSVRPYNWKNRVVRALREWYNLFWFWAFGTCSGKTGRLPLLILLAFLWESRVFCWWHCSFIMNIHSTVTTGRWQDILNTGQHVNLESSSSSDTGIIAATYPAVWGFGQLFTGKLVDKYCKKTLLFLGMFVQGIALLGMLAANSFLWFIVLSSLLL